MDESKEPTNNLTENEKAIIKTLKKLFQNACELTLYSQFVCAYTGSGTVKSRNEAIAENKIYFDLKNEYQNLAGIEDLLKIWPIRDKAIGFLETYGKSALEVAYKFIREAIEKRIPFLPNYPKGIHNFNCQEEELLAEIDIETEKFKGKKQQSETDLDKERWYKRIISWIFKKTSHVVYAVIAFVVTTVAGVILIDILANFGWFERIEKLFGIIPHK